MDEKKYKEAKQSYIDAKAAFEKATGSVEAGKADASKADYEKVQKIQDANEQIIQRTADYDIKMKACDDSINSLQDFLEKHKEGEWSKLAKNSLQSWESRKTTFKREINSLTDRLFPLLQKRAVQESQKIHRASKIGLSTSSPEIRARTVTIST